MNNMSNISRFLTLFRVMAAIGALALLLGVHVDSSNQKTSNVAGKTACSDDRLLAQAENSENCESDFLIAGCGGFL